MWIDYLGGYRTPQVEWLEAEMSRQRLGITDLILCEILQGIRDEEQYTATRRALLQYEVFDTGGASMALATAQNYRALRAKGYTVRKTVDCWIATFCLLNNHTLLHNDKDFEPFEKELGLQSILPRAS